MFTVPFGYCGEAPLHVTSVPEVCVGALEGWREVSGSSECFAAEFALLQLSDVDEVMNFIPLSTGEEAAWRAHGVRVGPCAFRLETAHGDAGFTGLAVCADGGAYLLPARPLTTLEIAERLEMLPCHLDAWYVNPLFADCYDDFHNCRQDALDEYDDSRDNAKQRFWTCVAFDLGGEVGSIVACGLSCGPAAPACLALCGGIYTGLGVFGMGLCLDQYDDDVDDANDEYDDDMAFCQHVLEDCIEDASEPSPGGVP